MTEEAIQLDIDEQNELMFKVRIEGTDPAPARVRLVCEQGDVSFMFTGHPTGADDLVNFDIPAMVGRIKEGVFRSRIEVLVENRYFSPVQFDIEFKKMMKVVAEQVERRPQQVKKEPVKVSAQQVIVPVKRTQQPIPPPSHTTTTVSPPKEAPKRVTESVPVRQPMTPVKKTRNITEDDIRNIVSQVLKKK